jgi:hypothetical protein
VFVDEAISARFQRYDVLRYVREEAREDILTAKPKPHKRYKPDVPNL